MLRSGSPLLAAAFLGLLAALALDRALPSPRAEVSRGSEELFASGLEPRDLRPREAPQRWTSPESVVRFRNLPPGPARLEVALHGHHSPVAVVVDGVILGTLLPGSAGVELPLLHVDRGLDVVLRTEGFVTPGGRRLGALLDRVVLHPSPARWPSAVLLLALVITAVAAAWSAGRCGFTPRQALGWAALLLLAAILVLLPCGAGRSGYVVTVS